MCQKMAEYLSGGQGVPSELEGPDLQDKHGVRPRFPTVMRTRCGKGVETKSKEFIFPRWHLPPATASPSWHSTDASAGGSSPTGCLTPAGIDIQWSHCRVCKCVFLQKKKAVILYVMETKL